MAGNTKFIRAFPVRYANHDDSQARVHVPGGDRRDASPGRVDYHGDAFGVSSYAVGDVGGEFDDARAAADSGPGQRRWVMVVLSG